MICFGMSNDTLVWRSVFSIIYLHLNAIKCLHSCTYELINDPFFSFTLHFFFIYCFISEISACLGGRVNPPPPLLHTVPSLSICASCRCSMHARVSTRVYVQGILQFTSAGESADREMSVFVAYPWTFVESYYCSLNSIIAPFWPCTRVRAAVSNNIFFPPSAYKRNTLVAWVGEKQKLV